MPVYEYIVTAGPNGEEVGTITLPLPVGERDSVQLKRREVPSSLAVIGHAESPHDPSANMLKMCKRMEQRHGNNSAFYHRLGHSAETIKKAWST